MSDAPVTPILDRVSSPSDLKRMSDAELRQLADELRAETISAVSQTGGHLGAGLGVVELTVALHAVFDAPRDKIIWDVSHQCYPHKILTGRRDRMRTLRQKDGLSGFTKRSESPYDPFGAAHSSTSISAALGFAVARDLGGASETGHGDAIAAYQRIPTKRPDHFADLAGCCAQLGHDDEARAHAARVLELRPDFSVGDYVEQRAFQEANDRNHLRNSLLRAGLPA